MIEQSRWVLDTNTLVSRLLAPGGVAARAVDHALQHGVLLVSEPTLAELVEVLARPKYRPYLSPDDRQRFLELLGGVAQVVSITRSHRACRDPKDDKILNVAIAGEARAIITADPDLLALDPFHDVRIVSPATFLTWP
jgi:putative PIN family toxin of toxin-antitoxin system